MAAYITLQDIRDEGVAVAEASDARVNAAIAEVSRRAETICGTWFEARTKTLTLDGNGRNRIMLPQPCITLTSATLDEGALTLTTDVYLRGDDNIYGIFEDLARKLGVFSKGEANLVVVGSFGTVDNSSGTPATPADIKRALRRWTILLLALQSDEDAHLERRQLTASSVSVQGRSLGLAPAGAPWSGDPEVDAILAQYVRARASVV